MLENGFSRVALNGGRYLRVELIGKPLGHGPCHKIR